MSKYGNRKVEYDGLTFDSKAERDRYIELAMLERVGAIQDLALQVPFVICKGKRWRSENGRKHRDLVYKADFVYFIDGEKVVEDVKGFKTKEYRIKKELMKELYDVEIREVRA